MATCAVVRGGGRGAGADGGRGVGDKRHVLPQHVAQTGRELLALLKSLVARPGGPRGRHGRAGRDLRRRSVRRQIHVTFCHGFLPGSAHPPRPGVAGGRHRGRRRGGTSGQAPTAQVQHAVKKGSGDAVQAAAAESWQQAAPQHATTCSAAADFTAPPRRTAANGEREEAPWPHQHVCRAPASSPKKDCVRCSTPRPCAAAQAHARAGRGGGRRVVCEAVIVTPNDGEGRVPGSVCDGGRREIARPRCYSFLISPSRVRVLLRPRECPGRETGGHAPSSFQGRRVVVERALRATGAI